MSEILMYIGFGCVVSCTLEMIRILRTHKLSSLKCKTSSNKPIKTIDNKSIDQPIIFSNINDNPDLEKNYAKLVLENNLLKEKLNQKDTLKDKGKYSKLAEELLKEN